MNEAIDTHLGPSQYLDSLITDPTEPWSTVYTYDGATLYRITDDHYVVFECAAHEHEGHLYLTRVLPQDWECFTSAVNDEAGFEAYHYGPTE